MIHYELTDREKAILRYVIHQFILTANPVGSRNISKKYDIGLSPATIRNIMSDLEETGMLNHPHTSAGRVPTDKGYRFYVDSLMGRAELDPREISRFKNSIDSSFGEMDDLLKVTSAILSDITKQLACITFPKFENAYLEKMQIVQLSSSRILVVVSINSGLVKTITLELDVEVNFNKLVDIERIFNENFSGLQLAEIRKSFADRLKDYNRDEYRPVIRVFLESIDKIFTDDQISEKSYIIGARNILQHPEFEDHQQFQGVIELIENKDVIVHLMEKKKRRVPGTTGVNITIGKESNEDRLKDYSMIVKEYSVGDAVGTVGIIGPKRMQYSKTVAAVVYVAEMLSKELKKQ